MKNIGIGVVVVVVVIVGLLYYFNRTPSDSAPTPQVGVKTVVSPAINDLQSTPSSAIVAVKDFVVAASDFKFSLSEIRVKKGETVRINFKNEMGFHDWRLDEFNVATKMLQVGQEETVEFLADKTGEFEYYCSVGNHRQMGMKGRLIVE